MEITRVELEETGEFYDIKDEVARQAIASLQSNLGTLDAPQDSFASINTSVNDAVYEVFAGG